MLGWGLIALNELRGLIVVGLVLAGLAGHARGASLPLNSLTPRGAPVSTDLLPILPAGGTTLESVLFSGIVTAVNHAALESVSLLHNAAYETWILEIEMTDPSELGLLVSGEDLAASFASRLDEYRKKGVLAR